MKKLFIAGIALSCLFAQSVNAQSVLSNLLSGVANAAATSATSNNSNSTNSSTGSNVLGAVVNSALTTATTSGTVSESTGNLLSTLLTSFAGDVTTTATTVVGTWSYLKPSVQFESENYLTQAGGAAVAEKLNTKLASIYKLAGIKAGKMTFTFNADGSMTYAVGSIQRQATYVFDASTKTLNVTTTAGAKFKFFVTVTGNNMYLTLDGSKFLSFMKTLGSKFSVLSTVSTLATSYQGMKVGFSFEKK